MSTKTEIPAIHDDDLKAILIKYNLYDKVQNKEVKCFNCETEISWENLYGIIYLNDTLNMVCNCPDCIQKITESN